MLTQVNAVTSRKGCRTAALNHTNYQLPRAGTEIMVHRTADFSSAGGEA